MRRRAEELTMSRGSNSSGLWPRLAGVRGVCEKFAIHTIEESWRKRWFSRRVADGLKWRDVYLTFSGSRSLNLRIFSSGLFY